MNQGQGQDKREYTLGQDLESLLARNFDSDRIVDIMSSAGYDPNEVATQINQRYESQRKDLLSQQEELGRINQEQKDLYKGLLKKKDSPSVQGGEPSRFGLAGNVQQNSQTPDFMLSESARAERELQDKHPSLEAVADPYVAQVNLMDMQAQTAYFNYNSAVVLSEQAQSYENQDPIKINKVLRHLQNQGLMTEFNVHEESDGKSEPYELEDLAKIAKASKKIASTATGQYNNVLETANKVNERNGIDFRYRPNSESDFNMFMSHSMERTLADEKKLDQEVRDEIDRVGEKAYYGTKTLGGAIKSDLYEAYEGTISGFAMIMHDIGKSFPNDGRIHEELYREAVKRREESDERKRVTTKQLAVNVGVDNRVFEMGITDRIGAALSGDIGAADFWIASTAQTGRLMADAFRTAGEFMIAYGIPLATDVFSNQYAETRLSNPHMGAGEVALHAAPKAATEFIMEKFMASKGFGATGALSDISRNLMGKEALKSSAKNVLGKKGGGFVGKYLLPEAFEEGIIGVTNQWIDMIGDAAAGRNARDFNFTEVADAFLGGFAGALGPAGLASLSSNVGHSRNMKNRLKVMEVLKDARALHDQETNPKTKSLYREKLVKAMADFEMITKEEMAFYGTLNPEEQGKVLGLNQELSRIKEILSQGKYWTGESVTKEDRATLEKRYEALMGSKTELEESALKRAEKESEEPVMSEDAGGQEVTSEPQEQSKEDSTKRKGTKEASDTAPKEEVEQMEMLFEYDESQDPTVDVESTATTDEDGDTVSTRVEVSEEYATEQLKEDGIENPTAEQVEAKQAELMEEGQKAVAEEGPRRGDKQAKRYFKTLEESETPEGKLAAIQGLLGNVANGLVLTAEEQALLDKATSDLEAEGYTLGLKVGETLYSGTIAKVTVTSTALDDKTFSEADDAGATKGVITRISKPQINKDGKLKQAAEVQVEIQELSDAEIDSKIRSLKKTIAALKKLGKDTSLEESDIAKLEAYKKARAKKGATKTKETTKEPESNEVVLGKKENLTLIKNNKTKEDIIETKDGARLIRGVDTNGKTYFEVEGNSSQLESLGFNSDDFTFDEKKIQSVINDLSKQSGKVEESTTEKTSSTFDTEVDGATNLIGDTENVGDGKDQMSLRQAEAIDNLTKSFKRKGAVKKIKFYKSYEDMAQYSPEVAAMMKEGKVKAFFDPSNNTVVMHKDSNIKDIREEFGHANLVDIIGKDAPSRKKLYNELKIIAKTNKSVKKILDEVDANYDGTDVIQEEAIVKVLREYAANPKQFEGRMARFIKMLNSIAKKFGNKGNVITGKESIIKLARKFELAAQGVATDVAVDPLAEAETDVNTPEATKDPIKKSFSKKSEFTYLKDAELFYTDVTSRQNKFTGVSKVASTKEKSVKVNDYFHYRNLWAKLTGNGKEASRMQDVFFLKDGKKYNVRAPKPKTDRAGKPLSIPTQMSFVERKLQSHFKKETAMSELLQQRAALMTEAGDIYSKNSKKLNFYTNMQDFSPTETEDIPTRETVESVSSDIEDHIIAKKNMLALIASDITAEDLKAIAGRSGHISKESNPELFNMSGVKKFNVIDVDGEIQDPSDTNRDVNPDATSGIRFSKDKGKVYRQNILDKKGGSIEVKKYLGKSLALKSKPWAEVAKGFKEGKTFNVAWDQVAAADFTFSGNPKTYKTRSGVDEVTSSDWGKSVSFRSHNLRKSFANKVKDLSGEVNVSISLNGANEMVANPLVFEAVVDNIFHQVREGVIDPEVVLKQANIGFNGRKSANKPSVFEAILESEDSYQFNDLIVKVSDGVYEWKDYKSFEEGHKLFLNANNTTMGHFKTVGKALTRDNFTADAQIKGDPVLPTMSDLREMLILPQYLSQTGKPVEAGTIAAVMTIDLDKMRGVSGGLQTRMDEGSAFPYAFNGGLKSIVTISDQPRTEDVFRISTPNKARTGTDTVKATAAEVGRGVKTVTSKGVDSVNEDIKFSKEGGIDTVGGMKNTETDQGEFELREMSAFQRARNRFLQKLANKYQYLFNLQEDVSKSKAQKLSEDQDFEMAETLMYGKAANDLEKLEGSIKEITEDLRREGLSVEEVEQYLYALHVKERNAVILERSLGEDTEGSGISDERSDEILNSISDETKEKLDPIVKKIREVQQNTRDTMVEFGLESQETIDVLEGLFKNYVPLGGLATDEQDSFDTSYPTGGAGMHVYGSTMKKAAGRKSEAPDILAQIVAQNAAVHIKARTNETLQTLYELVKNNPNKNVWSIVNRPNDGDAHSVAVRIEGKQKYIRFKDASYAETVRGLNAPASSRFTKLLKAPSSWLRASFTTLNPEFMISNFSRDIQSAVFNAAAETEIEGGRLDGAEVVKDMIKIVPQTLKALLKPRVGLKADPLIERYYEEYKADGGKTGWAYTEKIADIAEGLVRDSKDKSKLQRMLGTPRNMADFVEGINDAFENSIRLASYISARENGVSRSKSAQFAKNVTVNFNRNGEWGQALNGVYLFFNASVQGSMVIGRALTTLKPPTKPDGSTRKAYERVNNAQKLAFGLFLFSGLVTMMNRAMSDEDEDGVIFYDKIPDYIKERNIVVMNPRNGKDYYKIPLPYGYSLFSSLGSTAVDVSAGAKDWDEALLFLSSSTINAFSPISFGQSKDLFTHLGKSATPTVLKPIVDVMTNETYFGSPVYAAQSPYGVPKPESSMSFRSPKAMQEFFEWINEATGGSKQVSGNVDINPDKLWYIYEYAIGGAGKFINRSGQLVSKLNAKVKDNDFKFDANDLPFARILYGNASKYYDSGKYSENREVVTQLSKELADNRRIGDPLRYRGILILQERLKTYEKQLKVIRKQERAARDFEDFTKRSIRIQELRDKKNRIFMKFNRAYENLRKE